MLDPRAIQRFRKNKGAMVGLGIVLTILVFALFGPLVSRFDANTPSFDDGRGAFGSPVGPSRAHWLGTDTIFRDVFTRLAEGGRLSLQVAFVATVIAMGIGTTIGVVSGYFKGTRTRVDAIAETLGFANGALGGALIALHHPITGVRLIGLGVYLLALGALLRLLARLVSLVRGRARDLRPSDALDSACALVTIPLVLRGASTARLCWVGLGFVVAYAVRRSLEKSRPSAVGFLRIDFDDAVMRAVDVILAFPFLLLLMAISAAVDKTSVSTIFLVLGLTAWTGTARVIRGKTLQVRELEFIVASRALGQSTPTILLRHVLPNVAGIAIILATNSVAGMIVAEAALSFLGLSVPPPAASWGRMLDEGRPYYAAAPWMLIAPATAILLAVLGFNLLGEGLRDAFDPKDV